MDMSLLLRLFVIMWTILGAFKYREWDQRYWRGWGLYQQIDDDGFRTCEDLSTISLKCSLMNALFLFTVSILLRLSAPSTQICIHLPVGFSLTSTLLCGIPRYYTHIDYSYSKFALWDRWTLRQTFDWIQKMITPISYVTLWCLWSGRF